MLIYKALHFANTPFLWFIAISISLAYVDPEIGAKGGLLKPEITVNYVAVAVIFLISGVSLRAKELLAATCHYRVHIFIQAFSFVFIPLVVQLCVQLLGQFYPNEDILSGFVTVSCMPPPVSSAVLLTKTVGGNEAAAVFNSALGSFLGILITPALLYLFFSGAPDVSISSAVFQLAVTMVLPVLVGQFVRLQTGDYFLRKKKQLTAIGSFMLLLIIYTTFCETFSKRDPAFKLSLVLMTSFTVALLQFLLLAISFIVTSNARSCFAPEDVVAMVYCSTHKSLTLGFPMLKVLYGNDSRFILISFPLLVYHPLQILIGSILVPSLQKWMHNAKKYKNKLYSV